MTETQKEKLVVFGGEPVRKDPIPPAYPVFSEKELEYVSQVLDSHYIAEGPFTKKLEDSFAKFVGANNCVATSSGTAALHLAMIALGIKGGDEVITTPYTFISTSNSCIYVGAKPVFVDIDPKTYNIDVDKIEEKITEKTKAIIPVHVWGNPCNMEKIVEIAQKHNLKLVEDCSHAFGAEYNGKKIGTFGDISCFSLYATKTITSAMGGFLVTDDEKISERVRITKRIGETGRYEHVEIGYNYRTSDVHSAIGLAQLEKISEFLKIREENYNYLTKLLSEFKDYIELPATIQNGKNGYYYYAVLLKDSILKKLTRERFDEMLRAENITPTSYYNKPLHLQKAYEFLGYKKGDFPVAEDVASRTITLPIHQSLGKKDMEDIHKAVNKIINHLAV